MKKRIKAKRAEERLTHFACGACGKWWTIGDAPKQRTRWYCPWCGERVTARRESATSRSS